MMRARLLASAGAAVLLGSPGIALTALPGAAFAQPAAQLSEVVVTARKRAESLQTVPLAVSAFSGQQLEKQGVRTLSDISRFVPSLSSVSDFQNTSGVLFTLRGQSAAGTLLTQAPSVGLYVDSVSVPHSTGTAGALVDIQRTEILKGPQGTLYGRNTTGGAINIITRGADYNGVHGFVLGEVGNYKDYKLTAAVNVPIVADKFALRLAAQSWEREGFGRSVTTGERVGQSHNDRFVRLSLRFDPTPNLSSITKAEYSTTQGTGALLTLRGAPTTPNIEATAERGGIPTSLASYINTNLFETGSEQHNDYRTRVAHFVEDINWDITDVVRLRSITGYHKLLSFGTYDDDGSPFQVLTSGCAAPFCQALTNVRPGRHPFPYSRFPDEKSDSFTQEFNLAGRFMQRIDWLVGAFGSTDTGEGSAMSVNLGAVSVNTPTGTVATDVFQESWGVFTQNDIHVTDWISLTLGARYSSERLKMAAQSTTYNGATGGFLCPATDPRRPNGLVATPFQCTPQVTREHANGTSYLASVNFQITPDNLLYLKTSRGFKGGALQQRLPAETVPPAAPETATDYEIGLKNDLFDRRLRLNLAVYRTKYGNKQEAVSAVIGGRAVSFFQNAANATVKGAEADFNALLAPGWTVYGSGSYIKGTYNDFPCDLLSATSQLPRDDQAACAARKGGLAPAGTAYFNASGIPFALPHWQSAIGTRYERDAGPGQLGVQVDWTWRSRIVINGITAIAGTEALQHEWMRPLGLMNGRIDYTLPDAGVTVSLFATNLLNKHYQLQGLNLYTTAPLSFANGDTQEPRMWGVTVRKAFGGD